MFKKEWPFKLPSRVLEGSAVTMWISAYKSLKCYFLHISKKYTIINIYGLYTVVTVFWVWGFFLIVSKL